MIEASGSPAMIPKNIPVSSSVSVPQGEHVRAWMNLVGPSILDLFHFNGFVGRYNWKLLPVYHGKGHAIANQSNYSTDFCSAFYNEHGIKPENNLGGV